jgi:iron complex transport system substrate-binding protein
LRFRLVAAAQSPTLRLSACFALMAVICSCTQGSERRASNATSATATGATGASVASTVRDDFGRVVSFATPPRRVVSLNPTTTETMFAIGAGSLLVGRSHWDAWPAEAKMIPDMGNGIGINVEQIISAHPDLVLVYASEDNRAAAQRLTDAGVPTLSLRIDRIADFDRAIHVLGNVLGDSSRAALVADTVHASLARVARATSGLNHPSVIWPLIDSSPMVVGGGSFMNDLLTFAGARNVYADLHQPSPLVSMEDVAARNPDFVIRGGEGGSVAPLTGA